ncbi:replication-associated recombination protein A [Patescibacteria group bacterium]|nr:replication-associated recombination protein A [Patescibacteria group bacterium]MCL5010301.1 replication-associated recombination protein A [Patescibacteria group bacterium]
MNLAYRLRPQSLNEFFGQEHLVGKDKIIRRMIESSSAFPMILWGPPGSGKTTLAAIIASSTKSDFYTLSAVVSGKEELLKVIKKAESNAKIKRKTILFVDEIHRWNKAQQDGLLPYVETGIIILIGATTENPSFEVISPLLSRCKVFLLKTLAYDDLNKILIHALENKEKGVGKYRKNITETAKNLLIRLSAGDARVMLNALEIALTGYKNREITERLIENIFQTKSKGIYDKKADEHYNTVSAFIKSMRGGDANAAVYYLVRMLENGEDPKFIARRMIIFASEDIGLADRGALIQANAGFEAVDKIGMPESQLILVHICIYLSLAKKSRAVPNALEKAKEAFYEFPNASVPLHLRNAPTRLMKNLGYAKDYIWSEKYVGPKGNLWFLPDELKNKEFFKP